MKLKEGFKSRTVCGEFVLTPAFDSRVDFNRLISMNPTAQFLWTALQGKDFTVDDMVNLLLSEYEVAQDVANNDCRKLVEDWREAGILED